MRVKIAINRKFKDKFIPNTNEERLQYWREFNSSFQNFQVPPFAILLNIKQGYAYSAQHNNNWRTRENFIAGQHLSTDHDTGDVRSSIDFLMKDPFVQKYAYAIYTTPSHTPQNPRARVLYILDAPITNSSSYGELSEALCTKFDSADQKTKDPCRFFYGNSRAEIKILGNRLSLAVAYTELIAPYRERKPVIKYAAATPNVNNMPENQMNKIIASLINQVYTCPDGKKHDTLLRVSYTLGGYIGAGYLSEERARNLLITAISSRDVDSMDLAKTTIDNSLRNGKTRPLFINREMNWDDYYNSRAT